MIESLAEWNEWWSTGKVDEVLSGRKREMTDQTDEFLSFREIKTLMGIRRCGKSTLLYQFIGHILDNKKVDPKEILYINFEDPLLSKATLEEIFDAYQMNVNPDKKPYLFLDEVHRCQEWALFLRKQNDLRRLEQTFITDSSSKFIKSEYASVITGREINITVFPLSFNEYLQWNDLIPKPIQTRNEINRIRNHLETYLRWGGFPEVVSKTSDTQKKVLLNNYLADIIHKDIVERYNVDYQKIKQLTDFLTANPGALFSPRKYSRTYGLSLETLSNYIGHLAEVFLFFPVAKFDFSIKKQQLNPKKMYICDPGFCQASGLQFSENKGRMYENAVFLELKREGQDVFYWNGDGECDFIIKEGIKPKEAIQVCYDFGVGTKERELNGLLDAMDSLKIKRGLIITPNKEGEEMIKKRTISYIPLWKYLLSKRPA